MPRLKLRRLIVSITFAVLTIVFLVQIQLSLLNVVPSLCHVSPSTVNQNSSGNRLTAVTAAGSLKLDSSSQVRLEDVQGTDENDDRKEKKRKENDFWPYRMWFFRGGTNRPNVTKIEDYPSLLFSDYLPNIHQVNRDSDRIVKQLNYVPPNYNKETRIKTILMDSGLGGWEGIPLGRKAFSKINKCPVDKCSLVIDKRKYRMTADAILFKQFFSAHPVRKPANQTWIMYLLESPKNTPDFTKIKSDTINWIASYRHDSDIVTPYEKFQPYDHNDPRRIKAQIHNSAHNWAQNKTKKVAWFVSNCYPQYRLEYARELSKHIQVDIFGLCGTKQCIRDSSNNCFKLLNNDYKFYLAFENSHCRDYITEKLFINGLSNNIIPIVMGARKEDYERQAPPNSFIHVEDFESPKHLAKYLDNLNTDDYKYNEYFQWKGTGEFINTYFWCRLCAMLHAPVKHLPRKVNQNIESWWRGNNVCVQKNTLEFSDIFNKS